MAASDEVNLIESRVSLAFVCFLFLIISDFDLGLFRFLVKFGACCSLGFCFCV